MPDRAVTPNFAPAIENFSRSFSAAHDKEQANARQMDLHVIEAAKTNPALWDDPRTAKAAESVYGKDAAPVVIEAFKATSNPEHPAYNQLKALGLSTPEEDQRAAGTPAQPVPGPPAPTPGILGAAARGLGLGGTQPPPPIPAQPPNYAGSSQALVERAQNLPGSTVKLGPKGVSTEVKGKTQKESDETNFYHAVADRTRVLVSQGMPEDAATFQATREGATAADQQRILVPKAGRDLANADTDFLMKQRLERMKKDLEVQYGGTIATERTKGSVRGKEESPIPVRDLPFVMDPETGQSVPADTTVSEARRHGATFLNPKDAEALHSSAIGWEYAMQIHDVGSRLFTSDNPLEAMKNGAVAWGQAKAGTNPDAVALETLNKNWLLFVRNTLNEKGNIAARLVEKSGTTFGFYNTRKGFAAKERVMAGLIAASKQARGGKLSPQEQGYVDEVRHNIDIARGEDEHIHGAKGQPGPGPGAKGTQPPSSTPAPAAGAPSPAAPAAPAQPQTWQSILDSYPK